MPRVSWFMTASGFRRTYRGRRTARAKNARPRSVSPYEDEPPTPARASHPSNTTDAFGGSSALAVKKWTSTGAFDRASFPDVSVAARDTFSGPAFTAFHATRAPCIVSRTKPPASRIVHVKFAIATLSVDAD